MTEVLGSQYRQAGVSGRDYFRASKKRGEEDLASEETCSGHGGLQMSGGLESTEDRTLLALLFGIFRCSFPQEEPKKLDISQPSNVCHATHVTFDPFNGFHGLPLDFETQIPPQVPSASASVFGVSVDSMQCSYDIKGNSVPTILILLQDRLYRQGGLKAEGIFRINPENRQEKFVRDELNKGNVPEDIDVHCLASLIKAWLRELPEGVLDIIPLEQLLQSQTEQEYLSLVKQLPPVQASLLDWAVNLMADVAQEEETNKMNPHNIAMVFAPNMTQMADPLMALTHVVQVMNFLKALIVKTMEDRKTYNNSTGSLTHQ